jgi:transcriptional regulator GlxA family with amidase domain
MARTSTTRHVAVVAYPGVHTLDVVGPLEVFAAATRLLGKSGPPAYRIEILAARPGPVRTQSGLGIVATRSWRTLRDPIDTLLVAGGIGTEDAMADAALLAWLRRQAPRVRRLGSVCSGSFILAEAGLLDGRRATTHWAWCDALAARHPRVRVERDPIFVRDGDVCSPRRRRSGRRCAICRRGSPTIPTQSCPSRRLRDGPR